VLRPVLRVVAETKVSEAFTAAALLVVLGTALIVNAIGLSMALGAFVAGLLLADSEYRHELEADIEPFKGLLLGLFFMSVGMTANLGLLLQQPGRIALFVAGLLVVKFAVLWVLAVGSYWTFAHRMYHTWVELNRAKLETGQKEDAVSSASQPHAERRPEATLAAKTG